MKSIDLFQIAVRSTELWQKSTLALKWYKIEAETCNCKIKHLCSNSNILSVSTLSKWDKKVCYENVWDYRHGQTLSNKIMYRFWLRTVMVFVTAFLETFDWKLIILLCWNSLFWDRKKNPLNSSRLSRSALRLEVSL